MIVDVREAEMHFNRRALRGLAFENREGIRQRVAGRHTAECVVEATRQPAAEAKSAGAKISRDARAASLHRERLAGGRDPQLKSFLRERDKAIGLVATATAGWTWVSLLNHRGRRIRLHRGSIPIINRRRHHHPHQRACWQ